MSTCHRYMLLYMRVHRLLAYPSSSSSTAAAARTQSELRATRTRTRDTPSSSSRVHDVNGDTVYCVHTHLSDSSGRLCRLYAASHRHNHLMYKQTQCALPHRIRASISLTFTLWLWIAWRRDETHIFLLLSYASTRSTNRLHSRGVRGICSGH